MEEVRDKGVNLLVVDHSANEWNSRFKEYKISEDHVWYCSYNYPESRENDRVSAITDRAGNVFSICVYQVCQESPFSDSKEPVIKFEGNASSYVWIKSLCETGDGREGLYANKLLNKLVKKFKNAAARVLDGEREFFLSFGFTENSENTEWYSYDHKQNKLLLQIYGHREGDSFTSMHLTRNGMLALVSDRYLTVQKYFPNMETEEEAITGSHVTIAKWQENLESLILATTNETVRLDNLLPAIIWQTIGGAIRDSISLDDADNKRMSLF